MVNVELLKFIFSVNDNAWIFPPTTAGHWCQCGSIHWLITVSRLLYGASWSYLSGHSLQVLSVQPYYFCNGGSDFGQCRKQLMSVSPWQPIFSNCNFSHIGAGVAVALICALISFIMFWCSGPNVLGTSWKKLLTRAYTHESLGMTVCALSLVVICVWE